MKTLKASTFCPTNIALAKYWGKRDLHLNLPTHGSISLTLKKFGSQTLVEFDSSLKDDVFFLNGIEQQGKKKEKAVLVLDLLRKHSGVNEFAKIDSSNNFPTAAGLASSASGFAALTKAAAQALGLNLSPLELSEVARQGSGSACRSFYDGFTEWHAGSRADGKDSFATQILSHNEWPLWVGIAVVSAEAKAIGSTQAMEQTKKTSPYFESWVESAKADLPQIKSAIKTKDFMRLAQLAESNCLRMHACAMASFPPIVYWKPQTLELMRVVGDLRKTGVAVFFTIDAGANVVMIALPEYKDRVKAAVLNSDLEIEFYEDL